MITLGTPESGKGMRKSIFDRAVRHVHSKGGYSSEMISDKPFSDLINETNRVLSGAIEQGIHENQVPPDMYSSLREDVFLFSGCKTHAQLKELSGMLLTPDGKVKLFGQFSREAKQIHQTYNVNYLEAEYIFATSSAESAAQWADYEKDGDRYDLQYRTAGDDKVRDSHRMLNLTTLALEDPFWDQYYPPNGWRCRCHVVQVRKGKYPNSSSVDSIKKGESATTHIDRNGNNSDQIFRFNPGKQKVIFPPKHPYFQELQGIKSQLKDLYQAQDKLLKQRASEYEQLRSNEEYTDVAYDKNTGGLKATHKQHQFNPRNGHLEKQARDILFESGYKIILESEAQKGIGVKLIDGTINDIPMEISSITGSGINSVKHALNHCRQKGAKAAVLYFPDGSLYSDQRIKEGLAKYEGQTDYRFIRIIVVKETEVLIAQ